MQDDLFACVQAVSCGNYKIKKKFSLKSESKRDHAFKFPDALAAQYSLWDADQCMILLIVHIKNLCTFFRRIPWQLEKTLCLHADTGPSCKGFQSNCCNKLPINEAALFSQLTPDAECATPFASLCSLSSSRSPSQLPITFCPRLWQSNVGASL